jgi:hypothetical protein
MCHRSRAISWGGIGTSHALFRDRPQRGAPPRAPGSAPTRIGLFLDPESGASSFRRGMGFSGSRPASTAKTSTLWKIARLRRMDEAAAVPPSNFLANRFRARRTVIRSVSADIGSDFRADRGPAAGQRRGPSFHRSTTRVRRRRQNPRPWRSWAEGGGAGHRAAWRRPIRLARFHFTRMAVTGSRAPERQPTVAVR